jgi:hypothetical protein
MPSMNEFLFGLLQFPSDGGAPRERGPASPRGQPGQPRYAQRTTFRGVDTAYVQPGAGVPPTQTGISRHTSADYPSDPRIN